MMLSAASHCLDLGVYVDEAKKTLKNLRKTAQTELLRFSAEVILEKYENQGRLNL